LVRYVGSHEASGTTADRRTAGVGDMAENVAGAFSGIFDAGGLHLIPLIIGNGS
jgi:hypothetical protein